MLPGALLDEAVAAAEAFGAQVAALDVSRWTPGRGVTISVGVTLMVPGDSRSSLLRRAACAGGRVVSRPWRLSPSPPWPTW